MEAVLGPPGASRELLGASVGPPGGLLAAAWGHVGGLGSRLEGRLECCLVSRAARAGPPAVGVRRGPAANASVACPRDLVEPREPGGAARAGPPACRSSAGTGGERVGSLLVLPPPPLPLPLLLTSPPPHFARTCLQPSAAVFVAESVAATLTQAARLPVATAVAVVVAACRRRRRRRVGLRRFWRAAPVKCGCLSRRIEAPEPSLGTSSSPSLWRPSWVLDGPAPVSQRGWTRPSENGSL